MLLKRFIKKKKKKKHPLNSPFVLKRLLVALFLLFPYEEKSENFCITNWLN